MPRAENIYLYIQTVLEAAAPAHSDIAEMNQRPSSPAKAGGTSQLPGEGHKSQFPTDDSVDS